VSTERSPIRHLEFSITRDIRERRQCGHLIQISKATKRPANAIANATVTAISAAYSVIPQRGKTKRATSRPPAHNRNATINKNAF